MKWVLTKQKDGVDIYWTGLFQPQSCKAIKTDNPTLAMKFTEPRQAYDAAEHCEELQTWRPKRIEGENLVAWT